MDLTDTMRKMEELHRRDRQELMSYSEIIESLPELEKELWEQTELIKFEVSYNQRLRELNIRLVVPDPSQLSFFRDFFNLWGERFELDAPSSRHESRAKGSFSFIMKAATKNVPWVNVHITIKDDNSCKVVQVGEKTVPVYEIQCKG